MKSHIGAAIALGFFAATLASVIQGDVFSIGQLGFPLAGGVIVWSRPRSTIGWLLVGIGSSAATGYISDAFETGPFLLRALGHLVGKSFIIATPLIGFLVLLFPTGHLPSPRWRWPARAAAVASALLFLMEVVRTDGGPNPLGVNAAESFILGTYSIAAFALGAFAVAALANAFLRLRRSEGEQRQQLKWFASSALIFPLLMLISAGVGSFQGLVLVSAFAVGLNAIALAIGVAVLKYRLDEIDVVINKAIVFTLLTGFITIVYVGIVVGIGRLIGSASRYDVGLSLLGTTVVALVFHPLRIRLGAFANRIVYGDRLSPYEAVAAFARRIAESLSPDEVLPLMAESVAAGVGAERASVRLFLSPGTEVTATWPSGSEGPFHLTTPVEHQGELLGEIAVAKRRGESASDADVRLLGDMGSQAGLAMKNLRLTEILRRQLIDLQESRRRIVTAQDEERIRMERDLHDGAQQQLVSLTVKAGLVEAFLDKDPTQAKALLADIKQETSEALETLRDLARGLYPPTLRDVGLGAAVQAHVTKMNINASVDLEQIDGIRFPREVETPIYFCIREALQNASKYSEGAPISVGFASTGDSLTFVVRDEGPGFDADVVVRGAGLQNMIDRMEALGGSFTITSAPGAGTTVTGSVPLDGHAG